LAYTNLRSNADEAGCGPCIEMNAKTSPGVPVIVLNAIPYGRLYAQAAGSNRWPKMVTAVTRWWPTKIHRRQPWWCRCFQVGMI